MGQPRTASPHSPRSRETFYRAPTPAVRLPLSPPHPERRRSRAALPQSPAPHSIPPAAAGAGAQHRGGRGGAEGRAGGGTMWQEGTPGLLPSAAICPRACPAPSAARPSLRGREEEGERYRGRKEKKKKRRRRRRRWFCRGSARRPPLLLPPPSLPMERSGTRGGGRSTGEARGKAPRRKGGRARACVCVQKTQGGCSWPALSSGLCGRGAFCGRSALRLLSAPCCSASEVGGFGVCRAASGRCWAAVGMYRTTG